MMREKRTLSSVEIIPAMCLKDMSSSSPARRPPGADASRSRGDATDADGASAAFCQAELLRLSNREEIRGLLDHMAALHGLAQKRCSAIALYLDAL